MLNISYYALITLLFTSNLSVLLLAAIYIRRCNAEQRALHAHLANKQATIVGLEAKLQGIRTMA